MVEQNTGKAKRVLFSFIACACALVCANAVLAAQFTVNPVRLFFVQDQKTSMLSIVNNSDSMLRLQVSVFTWTQDEAGNDAYTPTGEVIAFPKLFKIEKDQERVIRLGLKTKREAIEKTYRIFLEELPEPQVKLDKASATVQMQMRISVPIFITPQKPELKAEILNARVDRTGLYFDLGNRGTSHFIPKGIVVEGLKQKERVFRAELKSWYLLAGKTRKYTAVIPREHCTSIDELRVSVTADAVSVEKRIPFAQEICTQ